MSTDNRFTKRGILIWLICAVFFSYEFLLRTIMGTFQHPIMGDLELTTFRFTLLSSTVYLAIYGIMQIPVGIILERYGLKRALIIGAFTCSIASLGFAFTFDFYTAIFFRFLMGFGSAFGFLALLFAVYTQTTSKCYVLSN